MDVREVTSLRAIIVMICNGLCGDIVATCCVTQISQTLKKYLVDEAPSYIGFGDAGVNVFNPRVMGV